MGKYIFAINSYYADNNYIEISEKEIELFEVNNKKILLKSLDEKMIKDSIGIRIESEVYEELNECINIAKKVYSNFLLRLNASDISYILDKRHEGNFCDYCSDEDANLYKEIIITDLLEKKDKVTWEVEIGRCGCTHFKFDKILNVSIDEKIKYSLFLNNYRKYLYNKSINSVIDNTLASASIEMLIEGSKRPEEEINVINEVITYLNNRYIETNNKEYESIMQMINNNRHKSINSLKKELIERYSKEDKVEKNLKLIKTISNNRTQEIHTIKGKEIQRVWVDQLLFDIQFGYMKDLYEKNE